MHSTKRNTNTHTHMVYMVFSIKPISGTDIAFFYGMGDTTGRVAVADGVTCGNPMSRTNGVRQINLLQSAATRKGVWEGIALKARLPMQAPPTMFHR